MPISRTCSVYEIVGPSGVYIGKTRMSLDERMRAHRSAAKRGSQQHIHRALRKYGVKAFSATIVLQTRSDADAYACEVLRVAQERAAGVRLYNGDLGGLGGPGRVQPADEKAKRAASMRGWAQRVGYKPSAKTRAKLRASHMGKPQPAAARAALERMNKDPEIQARRIAAVRKALAIRNADPANSARVKAWWAAKRAAKSAA